MRGRSILSAMVIGCLISGVAWAGITVPTVEVGCQPSGDLRVAWTGNLDEVDIYVELSPTTFWNDNSTDPSGELFYPGPGTFYVSIYLLPYEELLFEDFVTCLGTPDLVIAKDDGGATATPGATLAYTLTVTNAGTRDATAVEIQETVPLDTTFDAGSSSAGWACVPDGGAGSACTLALGTVAAGGAPVVRTFALTVDDPVAAGVSQIDNTASVSSDLADLDPADNTASDTTPLNAAPALTATKDATLAVDVDTDGFVDPGDTVLHTIVLTNSGNEDASGLAFNDVPDANTALVVGSVTTTQGTVTSGNGAGDAIVGVDVGTLAGGGGSATITYQVVIDDPLPAGVMSVLNQGAVSGGNIPDTPTDDPATGAVGDPTVVPVQLPVAAPAGIPVLDGLGRLVLLLMLALVGWWRLRS